ncbi:MAG: hypothetical protein AAGF67_01835, partial [Verrucomicrobiota bacterium]
FQRPSEPERFRYDKFRDRAFRKGRPVFCEHFDGQSPVLYRLEDGLSFVSIVGHFLIPDDEKPIL